MSYSLHRYSNAINEFEKDLSEDNLPQVSWVIAPTSRSEHATNHPAAGEDYTARLLKKLEENPAVYEKTAFILNYDEGGQFFDHSFPPTPPMSAADGESTVSTDGEVNNNVKTDEPAPIGLGFRVPLLIVSPWTRGNIVYSEVTDHTSVIQFLEKKFDIECPLISPWRRAMTGDLLGAFDFANPDYSWPELPDTSGYVEEAWVECINLPDPIIPEEQSMPSQEAGTKVSRALSYEFIVSDLVNGDSVEMKIVNSGSVGAPFVSYDVNNLETVDPLKYAVDAGTQVSRSLQIIDANGDYRFHLQGPNGFVRNFDQVISSQEIREQKIIDGDAESASKLAEAIPQGFFSKNSNADQGKSFDEILNDIYGIEKIDNKQKAQILGDALRIKLFENPQETIGDIIRAVSEGLEIKEGFAYEQVLYDVINDAVAQYDIPGL